jgi:hypothetical protein
MEGKNISGQKYIVTLRTLKTSILSLIGGQRFITNNINQDADYTQCYILIKSFWNDISNLWNSEFNNPRTAKLMTVPGVKGLSRYGRKIFKEAFEVGNNTIDFSRKINRIGTKAMDWSNTGPLTNVSGNAGASAVFNLLVNTYGAP